ncbi:hypothetical protein [uncultured Pelagibacterium sp.]|uniref:hypothetical protein n=1 Tax=uncultured Pelagibacterium sp. TaxID=1159875 RepID=UPI0030DB2F82
MTARAEIALPKVGETKNECWRLKRPNVLIGVFSDHIKRVQNPSEGKPERRGEQADNAYRPIDNPLPDGSIDFKTVCVKKGHDGAKHADAR